MLTKKEITDMFSNARTSFALPWLVLALLMAQPTASKRRFNIDHNWQPAQVIIELEFTLTLTASEDGKVVKTIELTEQDITGAHLPTGIYSGYESVEFYFKELDGKPTARLNYFFTNRECTTCRVKKYSTMSRYVYLRPGKFFNIFTVQSPPTDMRFDLTSRDDVNIGDIAKPYLCERTERVSFKKSVPVEIDDYEYSVELETRYFRAWPFNVDLWKLDSKTPTLCDDMSNSPSYSKKTAIIAGSVAGGVVFLAVIFIAVVLLLRRYRN